MTEMQTAAPAGSVRDDLQKLFECPVCVQVFRNPKLLPCGHSICAECCVQLNRDRISLLCPVCRTPSNILANKLPINFGLRDLVNHYADNAEAKKFSCSNCERRIAEDDCWSCPDCSKVVCSYCAVKVHSNHVLKEIKELLHDKENELAKWREEVSLIGQQVNSVRRQIDVNNSRILQCAQHVVKYTLGKKLAPQLETESKTLNQEMLNIQKRYGAVNAVRLIMDDTTSRNDFLYLKTDFQNFSEKQEKLLKRQSDTLSALRRCESTLCDLILPSQPAAISANISKLPGASASSPSVGGSNDRNRFQDISFLIGSRRYNDAHAHPCFGFRFNSTQSSNNANNSGSNVIRLRRPTFASLNADQNRERFFPDVINVENDASETQASAGTGNDSPLLNTDFRASSDDDIQLENYFPQPDDSRTRQVRSPIGSSSPRMVFASNRESTALNQITDESDPEDVTVNLDDEPVVKIDNSSAKWRERGNGSLARFYNQIERRMNSDMDDDRHPRIESVSVDGPGSASEAVVDMDITDGHSGMGAQAHSRATRNVEMPSTSNNSRMAYNALVGTTVPHKRGRCSPNLCRRITAHEQNASSSEGEHGEGEDEDEDPIDSTIRFRILRKR